MKAAFCIGNWKMSFTSKILTLNHSTVLKRICS
jgi:hypothetical protein